MRKMLLLVASFLLLSWQLLAQTRTVTGKVTDEQGIPLPNASVVVKGSDVGTTTKSDGTFSLTVPNNARALTISTIDYVTKDVQIGSQTSLSIKLSLKSEALSEVIVSVPYGTVKKTAFTGSETTISARSIEKQQVTSVTKALEGLVPGIIVTNGGGAPGSGADIRIRGIGSINASSSPLYVLNGVPYDGSIASISSDEIESVSVLKDAAAAALYGSRAANGVIMITTKKGRKGKAQVNVTVRQGFVSRGIPEYDRIGTKEYYELMWEAARNKYVAQGQSAAQAGILASNEVAGPNGLVYNAYNVDSHKVVNPTTGQVDPNAKLLWNESWEDALFRTASRQNVNVSVAGATDKSDYFLSMGYLNEEGTMKFTGYKRYNFRVNVNTQATSWLTTGVNLDGSYSENSNVLNGGSFTSNPFYYTRNMGPIYPVYQHNKAGAVVNDSLGVPRLDWGVPDQMGTRPYAGNSNLLGSLDLDERYVKRFNGNANTYMEIKFLKDFSFKSTLGFNILEDNNLTFQNGQYGDAQNVKGRSTKTFNRATSLTFNQVLSWAKTIGSHNVRALAGHENYKYKNSPLTLTRTGFLFPDQWELNNAQLTESVGGSSEDNHTIESYFGGVTYDYDGKYLLSGSIRRDATSRFEKSVRWGNFYSFGVGWRISQENFMKRFDWLNELKLKASYGEQGNENIGNTLYYQYREYYYADGTGGYSPPARPANPDLKWEGNKILNAGIDFALLNNRLQGSIEYFNRISDDLLFDVPLPISTGNASVYQNIGTMKNTGIEVALGYNVIRQKGFDWRVDVNFTHFKNKITKLPDIQRANGVPDGSHRLLEGKSRYVFYLREFAGVDAATGDALYYRDVLGADGKPTGVRNLTNNITNGSFYYMGDAIPDFSGGITNSFRYKNFELSILMTFSYGGEFYDSNYGGIMHSGSYGTAWHSDIVNRWQKPGDITNVPRLQNGLLTQDGASSRFLFDASYINFKNITLSYNFAKRITDRMHISGLSVFGNVDNAFLLTAKKGMDPQRSFAATADATYPPFRTITFGLNVNL